MKLVEFSVTNFRSITAASRIKLYDMTVLVGKNNEGKSNLVTALNIAITAIRFHSYNSTSIALNNAMKRRMNGLFNWSRDFPVQLQARKSGLESIFRLNFRLDEGELTRFQAETHIHGNEDIPIEIRIGKDNIPKIQVPKRGSPAYNQKSSAITNFISTCISFDYIQAVRTEDMAVDALRNVIVDILVELENSNQEYKSLLQRMSDLQQIELDRIANQLVNPLKEFLPQLHEVKIQRHDRDNIGRLMRSEIEIIINDGIPTNISYKGDGIKSLATLAILKERSHASIIAIEEPESHLHSGAIHSLVEVLYRISENNQVIITTHNPLFVQQNCLKANIIVDNGTAQAAKSIADIREILGVLPSDNLRNASKVFVVEGEDDKVSLTKILANKSRKISDALKNNSLVIKPLGGASNLAHDLLDLKHSLCSFFVLLDNDDAGKQSAIRARNAGVLKDFEIKYTICNGSPEAEFEDCIRLCVYKNKVEDEFSIVLNPKYLKGQKKWSDRMRSAFLAQGVQWDDDVKNRVKMLVAEAIPEDAKDALIEEKSGFINGVITSLENLIDGKEHQC